MAGSRRRHSRHAVVPHLQLKSLHSEVTSRPLYDMPGGRTLHVLGDRPHPDPLISCKLASSIARSRGKPSKGAGGGSGS